MIIKLVQPDAINLSHNRPWLILSCLLACLIFSGNSLAEKKLVLNTAFSYPLTTSEQNGFVDEVVSHALKNIGYDLESVQMPAERALLNANAGIDDGDLLRIGGLQKTYPNLIQVPEKVMDIEFVVFTSKPDLPILKWSDLHDYSVGIITGWKILERNITRAADMTKVKNVEQLFTLLSKDRVDTAVYSRWSGLGYMKQHHVKGVSVLAPPLARRGMFVYLHKKYKDLVPKLSEALKEMKADGSYQKIFEKRLAPLAGK